MINKKSKGQKAVAFGAVAGLLMGAWSMSSHAQTCTITNWQGGAVNDSSLFAGTPQAGNSRYAGPCSLAVSLDNDLAYVVDDSPIGEPSYIARFYFNPNGNASASLPMIIYAANSAADGSGDDAFQVWYNVASGVPFLAQPNHITLVIETAAGPVALEAGATGVRANGWNSIEVVWSSGPAAEVRLSVNGQTDLVSAPIDTSGQSINSALLGAVGFPDGVTLASNNPMFFDDFDSRRQSRPGRLCRGLTDETRDALTVVDVQAIFSEVLTAGGTLAAGQPDYNEDGAVTATDFQAVFGQILTNQADCELNS